MSSLDEYRNLGKDLSGYVAAVKTNSGALGLQETFKSGGKLFDVMQMLDQKEKAIRNYEEQLLKVFDPENPGEITRDYVNKKTAENGVELAEIKLLKDRLNDLSSAVGQKSSGFATTRAVNEFSEGVEKHEKVSKGFFSTFASFMGSIFKGKDEQKLVQASTTLDVRVNAISTESQERFTIPGKGKDGPEIPQPEKVVQKGLNSQEISGFSAPPIDPPPPLPSSMSEVRSSIPEAPPPPPMSEVGSRPITPPPSEMPPPLPSSMSEVRSSIPEAPPPPPMSEVGSRPITPPSEMPPPLPSSMSEVGSSIPEAPPPPMSEVGSPIPKAPPPPPPMSEGREGLKPPSKEGEPIDLGPKKDLMSEIRKMGSKKKTLSLNHPNYEHVTIEPKVEKSTENGLLGGLKARMGGGEEVPIEQRLLDGASKKDQQNILYSAMVDNNEKLVTALLKHQSEFNTGKQNEWEEDIVEKRSTFSPEQVDTVRKAAEETKLRVAAGIDLVTVKEGPKSVPITPKVQEIPNTTVKVENASPPPPPPIVNIGGGVPPPPPAPSLEVGSIPKSKPPKVDKPIIVSDSSDLLAQIREGSLKNLKSASQSPSLNSEEFTYTASKENKPSMPREGLGGVLAQAMQARRGDIEDSEELDEAMVEKLEKLSPQQQLNELYSAVIDGDKTRIARIIDVGNSEVFTKENMEKIASAAQKISATQDVSKKTIIEAGVKELAKEAKININVGESRGRS
jgi:hypothetical protein